MKQAMPLYICLALLLMGMANLLSCLSGNRPGGSARVRGDSARDSGGSAHDSGGFERIDTTRLAAEKKDAYLGYSYPLSMSRGETGDINAYITIRNSNSFIKDTLKEIVIDQRGAYSAKSDTIVIYPRNILFYRTLQLSLIDPSNDFTITRIHNSDSQVIDTVNGNRWRWSIHTSTDKRVVTLILKAVGMNSDGMPDNFEDKTIPIKITIDRSIYRKFFDYLTDNPAVSVPILVAFLGFIGWLIKYYMGKKKE